MNRWSLLGMSGLYVLVIILALMVVTNRHHARQLFAEIQELEKERDDRSADWSRLKLEQSARLNQVRVETQAKQQLRMQKPSADNIKVIRE
jgi:cell division protein FtsL